MYDHADQYRCIIIRGKSQRELDNLLPAYAMIVDSICPCAEDEFESRFNAALASVLRGKNIDTPIPKKTLDNHRTEIAGRLFGMYYISSDKVYYASERTEKFLSDNDQPAFFKDICYKMQFPNGMNKIQTLQPQIDLGISLRPYPFIIKCLYLAEDASLNLTVNDVGYYILNSLDVLRGRATPAEVIDRIKSDKTQGIERKIVAEGKASSYTMQHIREQINYLELANLIFVDEKSQIVLNKKESACLNIFAEVCSVKPLFDIYSYDTEVASGRKALYRDWNIYYSQLSDVSGNFDTRVDALIGSDEAFKFIPSVSGESKTALGDDGEQYVYEYEKNRVKKFNPRLVGKVIPFGKTRGLGYDIQSVIAEAGDFSEYVKYIEVKTTKRVTAPDISDDTWIDTVNITRNEWIAAQQHKEYYSIYRVYFVRNGVVVFVMKNIFDKERSGSIQVVPTVYRLDFSNNAVDSVIK